MEPQPLLDHHRGTAAAGQREVSVLTASSNVPKLDQGFLVCGNHGYIKLCEIKDL